MALLAVHDHLLELDTLLSVLTSRQCSVYIDGDNTVAAALAKGSAISKLSLNGLFLLTLRRKAEVQGYFYVTVV